MISEQTCEIVENITQSIYYFHKIHTNLKGLTVYSSINYCIHGYCPKTNHDCRFNKILKCNCNRNPCIYIKDASKTREYIKYQLFLLYKNIEINHYLFLSQYILHELIRRGLK